MKCHVQNFAFISLLVLAITLIQHVMNFEIGHKKLQHEEIAIPYTNISTEAHKRVRRRFIVRCCGSWSCSYSSRSRFAQNRRPNSWNRGGYFYNNNPERDFNRDVDQMEEYGDRAVATLKDGGISISCPNCAPGWQQHLKISADHGHIPIICPGCESNWRSWLSPDAYAAALVTTTVTPEGQATDEVHESDHVEETEEPTTKKKIAKIKSPKTGVKSPTTPMRPQPSTTRLPTAQTPPPPLTTSPPLTLAPTSTVKPPAPLQNAAPQPVVPQQTAPPQTAPVSAAPATPAPVAQAPITAAPVTQAPVTQAPVVQTTAAPAAPVVQPIVTQPPQTQPPATQPPQTAPPQTTKGIDPVAMLQAGQSAMANLGIQIPAIPTGLPDMSAVAGMAKDLIPGAGNIMKGIGSLFNG